MLIYQSPDGPVELLCEDYYIQEEWNGWEDTLHITLQKDHPQLPDLLERTRITDRESGQTYLITILDDNNITATLDLTELQADMLIGYSNNSDTMGATIAAAIPSNWTLSDHVNSTMRRTVSMDGGTPLDIIKQCVEKYSGLAVRFDTVARIIHMYWPTLTNSSGSYYTDELNLTERPHFLGRSDEFYTRLYPVGADGLTIADVNNGQPYVECHDYSDEVISAYWKDERYTDANALLNDAQNMVNEKGIPARSYTCPIIDLAKVDPNQYGHLTAEMYRVVTLIDRVRNRRVRHQIAQYRHYPQHPEKNTVTISTVPAKLSGRLNTVYAAVTDTAGKTDFAQRHEAAINAATALITGAKGGNVVVHTDTTGKPYEILIMDTDDIATAQNVWRWNINGWGHSSTGYNGPYTLAATMDGSIVADMIKSGTLNANLISAGILKSANSDAFWFDLDSGQFSLKLNTDDLDIGDVVTQVQVQYYLSTSQTALSGGAWSTTAPAWTQGMYMWSRTVTTLNDGTVTYSDPTCIAGAAGESPVISHVASDGGYTLKPGGSVNLTARIFEGTTEVDPDGAYSYTWYASTDGGTYTAFAVGKTITVSAEVYSNTMDLYFICETGEQDGSAVVGVAVVGVAIVGNA